MKKLIALILFIALAVPAAAAEYSPKLGMTFQKFVDKYNAVEAPLGAPYSPLKVPYNWSNFNQKRVAWFAPDAKTSVCIYLLSEDPNAGSSMEAGLDAVQIFAPDKRQMVPLISVADRCASIFSSDFLGVPYSGFAVTSVLRYFYENNLEAQGYRSYRSIDFDDLYALSFFYDDGYCYEISRKEDIE